VVKVVQGENVLKKFSLTQPSPKERAKIAIQKSPPFGEI